MPVQRVQALPRGRRSRVVVNVKPRAIAGPELGRCTQCGGKCKPTETMDRWCREHPRGGAYVGKHDPVGDVSKLQGEAGGTVPDEIGRGAAPDGSGSCR